MIAGKSKAEYDRQWRLQNKDKRAAYLRQWRIDNDADNRYKRTRTKRKYKLTDTELDALWAVTKCELCGGNDRLCIDHNHTTGKVRGRLCYTCNLNLGFHERLTPEWRVKADEYLQRNDPNKHL